MTTGGAAPTRAADGARALSVEVNAAAAANWLWLTPLDRTDHALYAGDPSHPMLAATQRQFTRVSVVAQGNNADAQFRALGEASCDYVVLPGVFEWWPDRRAVLAEVRRVLRPGGWLALAGHNWWRRPAAGSLRPGRGAAAVRAAGLRDVRVYGVDPDYARPLLIVPRRRPAVLASETEWRHQSGGNPLRALCAVAGLSDLLYRAWLVLGTRP